MTPYISLSKRGRLTERLKELSEVMVQASASWTYQRCGNKRCKCARGELHGPDLSLVWKEGGKTRGIYIRKGYEGAALKAIEAWKEFQVIARRLSESNREAFYRMMKKGGGRDAKKRG